MPRGYWDSREAKPKTCLKCGGHFSQTCLIDGKIRSLSSRKYCLTCSPFGKKNCLPLHDEKAMDPNRTCSKCGRKYKYGGKYNSQGHRKEICNSCKSVLTAHRHKEKALQYKGGACQQCGYDKCSRALCFHHVDSSDKFATVSHIYNHSWAKIQEELDKCVLLCMNCHAERHEELDRDRPYSRAGFIGVADAT